MKTVKSKKEKSRENRDADRPELNQRLANEIGLDPKAHVNSYSIIKIIELLDITVKEKRIYRRKGQLPDPTKAHDAEVNRLKPQFNLRMDRGLMKEADQKAKDLGLSRGEFFTELLKRDLGLD